MKFIKLHLYFKGDEEIYLKPEVIEKMEGSKDYGTSITACQSVFSVKETPEEILQMIKLLEGE
jgi:hypothetical protein